MSRGDRDKYDRQLRLWGPHGQRALSQARTCVLGAGPTATETLKNIVLPGCGPICVVDGQRVGGRDVANNFFCRDEDLGAARAKVVLERLTEMNPDVPMGGELTEDKDPVAGSVWLFQSPSEIISADMEALHYGGVDRPSDRFQAPGRAHSPSIPPEPRGARSKSPSSSSSSSSLTPAPHHSRSSASAAAASLKRKRMNSSVTTSKQESSDETRIEEGKIFYTLGSGSFFSQFTLVIVAGNELSMVEMEALSHLLWHLSPNSPPFSPGVRDGSKFTSKGIPLIVCRSYGMIGSVRVVTRVHRVVESKPDPPRLPDLHIANPWPELVALANNPVYDPYKLAVEDKDNDDRDTEGDRAMRHGQIPWVLLLVQLGMRFRAILRDRRGRGNEGNQKEREKSRGKEEVGGGEDESSSTVIDVIAWSAEEKKEFRALIKQTYAETAGGAPWGGESTPFPLL